MNNIVKEFNKISIDFLEQTSQIAGKKYLCKFKLITGINNMYAIDRFIKNVLPYREYINTRDESFFLNTRVKKFTLEYSTILKKVRFSKDSSFFVTLKKTVKLSA